MPTLTAQQRADLRTKVTNGDIAGFYADLITYGDSYGEIGLAVTNNDTWQGQIANAYAESAAKDNEVDISYGSPKWIEVNEAVALAYINAYDANSGSTPTRAQVVTAHENAYTTAGADASDWIAKPILNDSGDPDALWADYVANEGAGDVIGDAFGVLTGPGKYIFMPKAMYEALANGLDPSDLIFSINLLEALKKMGHDALEDMAADTSLPQSVRDLADWLKDIPEDARGHKPDAEPGIDDPSSLLERILPDWLTDALSPFGDAKTYESPLVLDLDGDGIELTTFNEATTTTFFDLDNDGLAQQTAWVGDDDGLLVRDLNDNGLIDDGGELFGSPTVDGFAKLALLDDNGDSIINQYDDAWADLLVWRDDNGDAVTQDGELLTLASLNIVSFDLAGVVSSTSTISGNPISHTSSFKYANGSTAAIADAWFVNDNVNTLFVGTEDPIDVRAMFLPTLRGFGKLPDLHIAMGQDEDLLDLVAQLASGWSFESLTDSAALDADIEEILFTWAGVDGVSPSSRGPNVDAQHLEFLEELFGEEFLQMGYVANPLVGGGEMLEASYTIVFSYLKAQLMLQAGAAALYSNDAVYNVFSGEIDGTLDLSSAVIDDLEDIASQGGVDAEAFWLEVAMFVEATKGVANLTGPEESALDAAVIATTTGDWDDIVNALPDISGAGYFAPTYGDSGNNTLTGTAINDELYGYAGNDTLTGGAGGDLAWGDVGDDIYVYTSGDDVYSEAGGSGTDEIQLPNGIDSGDLTFSRVNEFSLFISVGTLGSIEIPNFFYTSSYQIEQIRFYDTSTYNLTSISTIDFYGSEESDDLLAEDGIAEHLYGLGGDDELRGEGGNDTLDGGAGNDDLRGHGGDDTYVFSPGFDLISYETGGDDTLVIPEGYTLDDLVFLKDGTSLKVMIADLGQVTITAQLTGAGYEIDQIYFEENSTTVELSSVSVEQRGGTGNDSLSGLTAGASANDILNGMAGDDTLQGNTGNDTYVFSEGQDLIYEVGGTDKMLFWEGWLPADVDIYRQQSYGFGWDDLVVADANGNKTTIESYFDYPSGLGKIETIEFSDSTVWTLASMTIETWGTSGNDSISLGDTSGQILRGFAGDDWLATSSGNDVLDGGAGNDTLDASTGNDTYVFSAGLDTLTESGGTDTLWVTGGATINEVTVSDYGFGSDSKVILNASTDEIIVYDLRHPWNTAKYVETILFDDGFYADLPSYNSWLKGTSGDDTVSGNGNANTLIGYAGNDTIDSGGGADHAHGGSGDDTIHGDAGADLLYGGDGADTLYGDNDNDILYGGAGADTLQGDAGADTFAFRADTAFNAVDTIADFDVSTDDDVLDIADILEGTGYEHGVSAVTNFVQITDSGSDSVVKVDTTGTATFGAGTQVATLTGITGLTDEAALVSSGNLLVAA